MKSVCGAMLFLTAMVGCAVEEGPERSANDERAESDAELGAPTAIEVTAVMPTEAAKAMQAAAAQGLAPLFYSCPPRLTFQPIAQDANGNDLMTDWTALRSTPYPLDKPYLGGTPMRWYAFCGTTKSADPWVSLRKTLPVGYSACTTSAAGVTPAWLVCT